jgi:hypothetical protein
LGCEFCVLSGGAGAGVLGGFWVSADYFGVFSCFDPADRVTIGG